MMAPQGRKRAKATPRFFSVERRPTDRGFLVFHAFSFAYMVPHRFSVLTLTTVFIPQERLSVCVREK